MTAVDGIRKHGTAASYNKGCRCDRCSTAKRIKSQAYYQANRERIRERNRAWYAANKAQATETARKWQRANPEKVRGYVAKWSAANPDWERKWVAANPDKVAAKYKRYYESDKGLEFRRRWQAENADKIKAAGDRWRKANPDKVRQRTQTQRFKRRGAETLLVTPSDWRRMCQRYRGECHYCGNVRPLTQDHIIPLARGGRHAIGNIVPACLPCNSSKNARLIVEWLAVKRAA